MSLQYLFHCKACKKPFQLSAEMLGGPLEDFAEFKDSPLVAFLCVCKRVDTYGLADTGPRVPGEKFPDEEAVAFRCLRCVLPDGEADCEKPLRLFAERRATAIPDAEMNFADMKCPSGHHVFWPVVVCLE